VQDFEALISRHAQKGKALRNARRLCLFEVCENPELDARTAELMPLLEGLGQPALLQRNLKILLQQLMLAARRDGRYLAFPRGNSEWARLCRMDNPSKVSSKMVEVADRLVEHGLLEYKPGHYNRSSRNRNGSKVSRIRAKMPLLQYLKDADLQTKRLRESREHSLVILRNKHEEDISIPAKWRKKADRIAQRLASYNECLARHTIYSEATEPDWLHRIASHRIFNRSSMDCGGRMYGPWWVNMSSEDRLGILIDGEPVAEYDYSAQHPHLLTATRLGVSLQQGYPTPRDIYAQSTIDRDLVKAVLLVGIGAKNPEEARASVRDGLYKLAKKYDGVDDLEHGRYWHFASTTMGQGDWYDWTLDQLHLIHPRFQELLWRDSSPAMMNLDSQIADYVAVTLAQEDIPCLCVFDSFLVRQRDGDRLVQVMREAYSAIGIPLALPPIKRSAAGERSGYVY
jgi:hypothetical protein